MSPVNKEPLYIVDGSGFIFRAYYGIRAPMSAKDGTPTNAVYGFVRLLLNAIRDKKAKNLVVVFDPPGPTFRVEIYDAYKANRSAPPDDLIPQFALCREAVAKLNIPSCEVSGYEADDVIATLARHWTEAQTERDCVIITADKDLCQLVDERVTLWDGKEKETDAEGVVAKFGVPASLVIDALGLAGDASDNIPGVPGIGLKTAATLLNTYGGMSELLDAAHTIKGKRGQNLVEFRDQALLSKELATIITDVAIDDLSLDFELSPPEPGPLADFFRRLNFRRFLEEFDLSETAKPKASLSFDGYRTATSFEELEAIIQAVRAHRTLSFDLETTSLNPLDATIVGFAVSWAPGMAAYIPVGHTKGPQLATVDVLEQLAPLLRDSSIRIYGQNLKYDLKVLLNRFNLEGIRVYRDSMIAAYLLDPGRRQLGLDHLALEVFGHVTIKFKELLAKAGVDEISAVSIEETTVYACEDADVALRLGIHYETELTQLQLTPLEQDIENPLINVLARMESTGIRLIPDVLRTQSAELTTQVELLRTEILEMAGEDFNVDSPKQLACILFEKLELPEIKRTKTGQSTDHQVLQALTLHHPIAARVLDYRQLVKLKNTYLDTLPNLIHSTTARIHTQFRQAVTATGRLSSSEPNLQNIPIRTSEGRRVREAFVPSDGYTLISADYSQIELRLLAHYSEDPGLVDGFREGADIHRRTAAEVFDVPIDAVSSDQRRQAKSVNFGLMYGMSAFRLSNELSIPQGDARRLIKRYFSQYAGVKKYFEIAINDARTNLKAKTLFGRVRTLAHINSRVFNLRQQSERLAINTPIQGTAADILKVAMLKVQDRLDKEGIDARMLLTVHDELVLECKENVVDATVSIVKEEMEAAVTLRVPLVVEVGVGASWAQIH
jgi:DNA polymerase I